METEYCDNDAERRALKSALVEEIRKRKAAGLKVNVLMRELHKLDDPFGGIGIRGTETAGRSASTRRRQGRGHNPARLGQRVMAAKPTELTPTLAPANRTGNFTLLRHNQQKIMSRLL
jgi:hypothetical protein